jgi:hypothetical protein
MRKREPHEFRGRLPKASATSVGRRTLHKAEARRNIRPTHGLQRQLHAVVPVKFAAQRIFGERCVIRENFEIVIVQHGHSRLRGGVGEQNATFVIGQYRRRLEIVACVVFQRQRAVGFDHQAHDPGRVTELHIYALRTVLKEPLPAFVALVIAVDEAQQRLVTDRHARRTARLRGLVAHTPVAAPVEHQPAGATRYVRPLGQRLFDDVIHDRRAAPDSRARAATTSRCGPETVRS